MARYPKTSKITFNLLNDFSQLNITGPSFDENIGHYA